MRNPFRTWRLRKCIIVGAGAVLLLAGATLYLIHRLNRPARTEFPDYSAALQYYPSGAALRHPSKKELLNFAATWPTLQPDENAAVWYLKAGTLVSSAAAPPGAMATDLPYAGDMAALEKWVEANRAALDAVVQGNKLAYCRYPVFVDRQGGVDTMAQLQAEGRIRQLAGTCADAGIVEELKGDPDAAADWRLACIRMGAQAGHGSVNQNLVGGAVVSVGRRGLEGLVANANLSDKSLRNIIACCVAAESSAIGLVETMECERESSEEVMRSGGIGGRVGYFLLGMRRGLEKGRREAVIPLCTLLAGQEAQGILQGKHPAQEGLLEPVFLGWRKNVGQQDVSLRVMQIRAAIALYQRENGKLPENLDALCPKFLPSVPLDPFSGKPLRYERTEDGWKLWSVGDDLKDDDGASKSAQSWSDGPDYLFTSKAQSNLDRIMQVK